MTKQELIKRAYSIAIIAVCAVVVRSVGLRLIDNSEYSQIKNSNDITLINSYLKENPESSHLEEINEHIRILENDYYSEHFLLDIDDILQKDIDFYLRNFPSGKHCDEVRKIVRLQEEQYDFKTAQIENTSEAWDRFVREHPESEYIAQAKQNYERIKSREIEEDDYQKAQNDNTIRSWQNYLSKHPKGEHANIATAKIEELTKIERIRNNQLANGSQPWRSVYGRNHSRYNDFATISIQASREQDVIVVARSARSGQVEGHIYVRKGSTASFDIPAGRYEMTFCYGNGWDPSKKIHGSRDVLPGGFAYDVSYQNETRTFKEYSTNSYKLSVVYDGNLQLNNTTAKEAL